MERLNIVRQPYQWLDNRKRVEWPVFWRRSIGMTSVLLLNRAKAGLHVNDQRSRRDRFGAGLLNQYRLHPADPPQDTDRPNHHDT